MNRFHRFLMRRIELLLCFVLISTAFLSACDMAEKEESRTVNEETSVLKSESQKQVSDSQADKTETVYGKADASGKIREIQVEALLKNPNPGSDNSSSDTNEDTTKDSIEDFSALQDIKNTKGDEEFVDQGNGVILWENHGEDIHYKGTSQSELPVSVKISYFLNGKEINPEDIAGKSGEVRIRFDYENHTAKSVKVDGKQVQVKVPFAVLSAMVLPSEIFSNIQVSGGKLMTLDEQNVVVGFAYPGLEESLKLADYEPTEDISLPDHVEVTAQAENFELDFTATVITTGTFSDLDLDDLNDVNALIDDMSSLTDASSELTDGTAELLKGASTFQSYMKEYVQGVDTVNEGAEALTSGLKTLNSEKKALETGAAALQKGLNNLNASLAQFSFPSADDSDSANSSSESSGQSDAANTAISALATAGTTLITDARTLASQLSALQESLDQIQDFTSDASAYTAAVQNTVKTANSELSSAIEDLKEIETNASSTARQQAREAAEKALADTDLNEEEKAAVQENIANNINLSGITDSTQSHINAAISQLNDLPVLTIPELSIDSSPIMETITNMQTQISILQNNSSAPIDMTAQLSALQNALDSLKDGAGQLQKGSEQLTEGIAAFSQGIEQLYNGSTQLSSGTKKLSAGGSSLTDGFDTLADGLKELKNGITVFDEEGIQSLGKLAGDDLAAVITRIKALKKADSSYNNFSGIKKGQTGSVRFIIETDEIAAE